ncbi:uncharacterized protein RCO7_05883 [Rhynchosporium graminicola]|uniref:Zn(2)-C6 fungal-type domain-containing protein n=1 Tax=Rhynchosporium graminicola TaxID=2792576 RepID=A0A1E1KEE2_9HELO|nr:uncharacterized protein RCO7_05883 [Rhynchosporium commune]
MSSRPGRQRLRVKTSCAECRKQKKKCDETKPSCLYCLHYKREFCWPTDFVDGRHGRQRASSTFSTPSAASSSSLSERLGLPSTTPVKKIEEVQISSGTGNYGPQSGITWFPVDLGKGHEKLLFHHFSTCTLPTAIRRHAHPAYSKYHDVIQFAFERPDIMRVFLGIAALRIGHNNKNFAIKAIKFYTPSVSAIARSISEGKVNGTEEWLLVLIAFMTSRFELRSNVMLHLRGLAQVFYTRKLRNILPQQQRPFHRISAEAFAYHLATYSLLHSADEIDAVAQQFSWSDLEEFKEAMPFPEASRLANSPILGLIFDLFTILDLAEKQLMQELRRQHEEDQKESHEIALLYTLVTKLFLSKILTPKIGVENINIQHVLHQALYFVGKCKEMIKEKVVECRQWTHSGQIYRSSTIIAAIWKDALPNNLNAPAFSPQRPRGLDRLLHIGGLLDTLSFTS